MFCFYLNKEILAPKFKPFFHVSGEEVESIYVDEEPGGADASASPSVRPPHHVSDSDDEEELEDLGLSAEAIEAALAKFQDGESDSTGGSTVSSSRRTSLTSSQT